MVLPHFLKALTTAVLWISAVSCSGAYIQIYQEPVAAEPSQAPSYSVNVRNPDDYNWASLSDIPGFWQNASGVPLYNGPGNGDCEMYMSATPGGSTIVIWQPNPEYAASSTCTLTLESSTNPYEVPQYQCTMSIKFSEC